MENNLIIDLYKKQFKIICLYLVKNGCSINDAEDIVHESFIKAIEYIECIEIKNLSSWLFRVSINNYKNRIRRGKIIKLVSINKDNYYERLIDECNVEEQILSKERYLGVIKILDKLGEVYKALIILKYEMNLTYKEIALLLGKDENTIKTYLYRARNKFKEEWRNLSE